MRIRKGSYSYKLLQAIQKAQDVGVLDVFSYSAQMKYLRSQAGLSPEITGHSSKYVKRLIENGVLEYEKGKEQKSALKLTSLGKDFLGLREEWDGKFRVVIWDIPENKRRLRDLLRRKLKEWKFVSLQKSVWVSKRNVTEKLRQLVKELEMTEWVIVIESDDSYFSDIKFHDRGS